MQNINDIFYFSLDIYFLDNKDYDLRKTEKINCNPNILTFVLLY